MFQRRHPLSLMQKLKEFFWPSMGFKRSLIYVKHRLVRLSDSTHKIAIGLAIGCGISFTPIVGTHFIQAGILAYLFGGNMFSAIIGTFVGNPWTFPFMWWSAIKFGSFLFGVFGLPAETAIPEHMDFWIFVDLVWHEPLRIFLPWAVGGYLLCMMSIPFSYMAFYRLIHGAKVAKAKARLARVRRAAREMTRIK